MKAALVVFDRMTTLDFIGFYDPLTRLLSMNLLPELDWKICALQPLVTDDRGLTLHADYAGASLAGFDLLFIPGGLGTRSLRHESTFVEWLKTAADVPLKTSVCTGALLLGAAGYLREHRATTHPTALKELEPYCKSVVTTRIVDEGDIITAGGVTAAIDLGLHVVERLAGVNARRRIARQMDYSDYLGTAHTI